MLRHARRAVAAMFLTLVLATVGVGPRAAANFPGRNGQIVFQRFDAERQLADLGRQPRPESPASDHDWPRPAVRSRHGRPMLPGSRSRATARTPTRTTIFEIQDIFTMRPDGSDLRQITDADGDSEKPGWSPDGRSLLYAATGPDYPRTMGIYLTRSDGSRAPRRLTRLTGTSFWQELARFSPDGRSIEYTEYRPAPTDNGEPEESALMIARADGSHPRQITPWALRAVDADWSPDGRRLVFASRLASRDFIQSVMVIDADGRHQRELTSDDGLTFDGDEFVSYQESFNSVWSPDGKRILFVRATFTDADGFDWA